MTTFGNNLLALDLHKSNLNAGHWRLSEIEKSYRAAQGSSGVCLGSIGKEQYFSRLYGA